jgi:hypothetical protein
MSEQTTMPVPAEPTSGPCAWCDESTRTKIEIEPAVRGKDKATGVSVIKRFAVTAWACPAHLKTLRLSEAGSKRVARSHKKAGGAKGIVIR